MKPVRVHFWCLKNIANDKSLEGLMFDEVRAALSMLDESDFKDWKVWRDDWEDWKNISDVVGLTEPIVRALTNRPPGIAERQEIETPKVPELPKLPFDDSAKIEVELENVKSFHAQTITQSGEGGSGEFVVRRHKRYKKRYEIQIVNGAETFITHSRDISVGGVYVEDSLPDWLTGYFKVRIRKPNQKHQIELTCCLVENQAPGARLRLSILPFEKSEDEKNLELWLAA